MRDITWVCGSNQRIEVEKFLCYFISFCRKNQCWAACQQQLAAIRWFLKIASQPDPTSDQAFSLFRRGLKRLRSKPPVRKQPADIGILSKLYDLLYPSEILADWRDLFLYLLCYAGFLRASEALRLEIRDLDFSINEGLKLTIRSSKTDRFRMGSTVLISRIPVKLCPVASLQQFLRESRGNVLFSDPVFLVFAGFMGPMVSQEIR